MLKPLGTEKLAQLNVFREKENELEDFINKQLLIYESYEDIPREVKSIIDSLLITLGKYGKDIGIQDIEDRIEKQRNILEEIIK